MRTRRAAVLLLATIIVACTDSQTSGPAPAIPVARIELVAPAELTEGQAAQLSAIPRSAAGDPLPGRVVRWYSSQPAVAQVNASGRVVALEPGLTTISAVSEGRMARSALRVVPAVEPVAHVTITEGVTLSLVRGTSRQLHAEARSASGELLEGRAQVWSSSDPAIVSVSGSGVITATGVGDARVTVSVEGKSASIAIRALSDVVLVEMEPPTLALPVGEIRQIVALPRGEGGHVINTPISWRSEDTTIATVGPSGRVRGVRPGWTWVTATALGKVGAAFVIVSTWTEFVLTDVAGSPPPATLFAIEVPDTSRVPQMLRYEAVNGSLKFLENTDHYQQSFTFRIHRDGQPSLHLTSIISGRVELDWLTGRRILHPINGAPSFTVEMSGGDLIVRQRYFPSVPEVRLTYGSIQLPAARAVSAKRDTAVRDVLAGGDRAQRWRDR